MFMKHHMETEHVHFFLGFILIPVILNTNLQCFPPSAVIQRYRINYSN